MNCAVSPYEFYEDFILYTVETYEKKCYIYLSKQLSFFWAKSEKIERQKLFMDTIKIDRNNVRLIAHRGLIGLEKENTCAAFVAAGNRESIFGIETDVHHTRRYPDQPAQYLMKGWDENSLDTLKKQDLSPDIRYTCLTKELVEQIHSAGLQVNCWRVNTKEAGETMVELGVDYITTDILRMIG